MSKKVVTVFLGLTALLAPDSARTLEEPTGSVCVSRVPDPTPGERSLANPTGGKRAWAWSVQVDDGPAHDVTAQRGVLIDELALGSRHLIRIRDRGKLVASFRFTFERQESSELCLWFKPLYETWSLWPMKDAAHLCSCESMRDDDE